MLNIHMRYNVA